MLHIESYRDNRYRQWQAFVANAKNGVFLFQRGYMGYHADCFNDSSLMCYDGDDLIALLPACITGSTVSSHAGLTYGGFVTDSRMKTVKMLALFDALHEHLLRQRVDKLIYKPLPHIYHLLPAEEDLYALFHCGATLVGRNVASVAAAKSRPSYSKGRKACIKKGKDSGLAVMECQTPAAVMQMVAQWLGQRHQVAPVHSAAEMQLLMQRFPDNIRAFAVLDEEGAAQAGAIIYETAQVAHCQYIVASDDGRARCAPDLLMAHLLDNVYAAKPYFDWGTSNAGNDGVLAETLAHNKESFGGRAVCYDCYQLSLA